MSVWSDYPELVPVLKTLWNAGDPVSTIATELSKLCRQCFTRDQIIGKAHRMKLGEHAAETRKRANRGGRKPSPRGSNPPGHKSGPALEARKHDYAMALPKPSLTLEAFDAAIPVEQRKSLFNLADHECHWIVGEGESKFYCGGPVERTVRLGKLVSSPYCSFHKKIMYHKITPGARGTFDLPPMNGRG